MPVRPWRQIAPPTHIKLWLSDISAQVLQSGWRRSPIRIQLCFVETRRIKTLWIALWLGVIALVAGAFEQQQFGFSALTAGGIHTSSAFKVPTGYHMMPDGILMAGAMHGATPDSGREADEPPSDGNACTAIAAMGVFTTPLLIAVLAPGEARADRAYLPPVAIAPVSGHPAYASRAPPRIV